MAKNRMINTRFWDDNYIVNLDPIEKLMFLYFITNPLTNICGIYEIQIRRISFDTGIDKDMVLKILERFKNEKKIYYIDGWIYIKNFSKHQASNESIKIGSVKIINLIPDDIIAKIREINTDCDRVTTDCDRVATDCGVFNLIKSNLILSEKDVASDEEEEFNFSSKLKVLLESKDQRMPIIATYWLIKGIVFENKDQYQAGLKRELRDSGNLKGYDLEHLSLCMNWHKNKVDYDWKLGTIHKNIDKFKKDNQLI